VSPATPHGPTTSVAPTRLEAAQRDQFAGELAGELAGDVQDLVWRWARRLLALGPDDPPFSEWENLPPAQARRLRLALLAACERLRTAVDERARQVAHAAAAVGADYGELGDAVGMTRQGARRRWPGLAEMARAARGREAIVPPFRCELYVPNADAGQIMAYLVAAGHTGREAVQGEAGVHIGLPDRQAAEQLRIRLVEAGYRPSEVQQP
jgi:hypothetical protein